MGKQEYKRALNKEIKMDMLDYILLNSGEALKLEDIAEAAKVSTSRAKPFVDDLVAKKILLFRSKMYVLNTQNNVVQKMVADYLLGVMKNILPYLR